MIGEVNWQPSDFFLYKGLQVREKIEKFPVSCFKLFWRNLDLLRYLQKLIRNDFNTTILVLPRVVVKINCPFKVKN